MFGLVISGRPVITNFQTVSETQLACQIPSEPTFNNICVFLLPGQQLPDGSAAAVYVQLPNASQGSFKLIGAVANEKPSAIFKVNLGASVNGKSEDRDAMLDEGTINGAGGMVCVGISLEPAQQVASNLAASKLPNAAAPSGANMTELVRYSAPKPQGSPVPTKVLAQRIIQNAFNFLSSFGSGDSVPIKAFQEWWTKFEKKVERDPGFLERGE